ncbi:uncharacterized protein PHACADRAFT_266270 [Phanerochaete carnosa HHB-10118-sp]|uniref:Uncharacterized protein n=1 Tax=Phanerochaete carnosa (strain HHB-10118-sp) TaxID=650164 RepID=K5VPF0_PHACS|nr:uncharacterized protein PHACADRAFT_266270 [Phanerochaete carnosa HHB-10118-sp]EKM48600.1 hypothetical protein PHACADRAFT_266270 [Phanerochaete carnosa HHB-10118-sp]
MLGPSTVHWFPEQLYASQDEAEWYDRWTNLPLPKHAPMLGGSTFPQLGYDAYLPECAEQQRPQSSLSFSGLSTPGLSWRDSSCSPLSSLEDPALTSVPNAADISFSTTIDPTSPHLTSSPHSAFTSQPSDTYTFDGSRGQGLPAYTLEPNLSLSLSSVDEILACEASWPSVLLGGLSAAGAPLSAPHMPPSPSDAAPAQELPELQHPKPLRLYVPPWQTATEFDLAEFIIPQRQESAFYHSENASSCQAGPPWVIASPAHHGQIEHAEEDEDEEDEEMKEVEEDGFTSEDEVEELMDLEWMPEDQSIFTHAQQDSPAHRCADGPTLCFGNAMLPSIVVHQHAPQILPPDALLYQPLLSSVASNVWATAESHLYAYAH